MTKKSKDKKIVKPPKAMMKDTTTGMGANIYMIPKKKPKKGENKKSYNSKPIGGGADTGKKGERKSKLITMLSRYTTRTRGSSGTNKNKKKN